MGEFDFDTGKDVGIILSIAVLGDQETRTPAIWDAMDELCRMAIFESRVLKNKSTTLIARSLGMSDLYSPRRYLSGNSAKLYGATGFGPRGLSFEG